MLPKTFFSVFLLVLLVARLRLAVHERAKKKLARAEVGFYELPTVPGYSAIAT